MHERAVVRHTSRTTRWYFLHRQKVVVNSPTDRDVKKSWGRVRGKIKQIFIAVRVVCMGDRMREASIADPIASPSALATIPCRRASRERPTTAIASPRWHSRHARRSAPRPGNYPPVLIRLDQKRPETPLVDMPGATARRWACHRCLQVSVNRPTNGDRPLPTQPVGGRLLLVTEWRLTARLRESRRPAAVLATRRWFRP